MAEVCPICLVPIQENENLYLWRCAHKAHDTCIGSHVIDCPVCRIGNEAATESPANDPSLGNTIPQNVLPICCPRLAMVDGRFQPIPDRRMRSWYNTNTNQHGWECLGCGLNITLESLRIPEERPICDEHGARGIFIDMATHTRYWCCSHTDDGDVPFLNELCELVPIDTSAILIEDDSRGEDLGASMDEEMGPALDESEDADMVALNYLVRAAAVYEELVTIQSLIDDANNM